MIKIFVLPKVIFRIQFLSLVDRERNYQLRFVPQSRSSLRLEIAVASRFSLFFLSTIIWIQPPSYIYSFSFYFLSEENNSDFILSNPNPLPHTSIKNNIKFTSKYYTHRISLLMIRMCGYKTIVDSDGTKHQEYYDCKSTTCVDSVYYVELDSEEEEDS